MRMSPFRERIVGAAEGRVLEWASGSGLNLPFYRNTREIIGLDPAPRLLATILRPPFHAEPLQGAARAACPRPRLSVGLADVDPSRVAASTDPRLNSYLFV